MGTDGQCGVEQQHALVGPAGQVSARRDVDAQVALDFLEDVLQRGRESHAVVHGEAKPMCLSGTMIGILTDDDDFCPAERTEVERIGKSVFGQCDGTFP